MNRLHSLIAVVAAGTSLGIFLCIRAISDIPSFDVVSASPTLPTPFFTWGFFILLGHLGVFVLWFVYSLLYSLYSGESVSSVLELDAYTYLPLCLLTLSLLNYSPLAQEVKRFWSSPLFLIIVLMSVAYLKVEHLRMATLSSRKGRELALSQQRVHWKVKLLIFLLSFSCYILIGFRVTDPKHLGGDEPHYLLIADSLLHDHDLAMLNNYSRKDVTPHISIAKDGTRYPGHPIGLPLLLLPAYAFKGPQGSIFLMNFLAALLSVQLYVLIFSIIREQRFTGLIWFIVSFTSPLLIYSSKMYPDIPSALLLITAYQLIAFPPSRRNFCSSLILGGSLAFLPWLHQRMLLPTIILALYYIRTSMKMPPKIRIRPMIALRRLHAQHENPLSKNLRKVAFRWEKLGVIVIPLVLLILSGSIMAGYYYIIYGNPLPNAPYTSVGVRNVFSLKILLTQGLLGHLFDQEAGLLMYSPYYLFFLPGLFLLARRHLTRALWLFALIASIYLPSGGFEQMWRGGWSPASRFMVTLIPFFLIPLCVSLKHLTHRLYYYIFALFALFGLYWSRLFLQTPSLAIMRGAGKNNLFAQNFSGIDTSQYFPTFPMQSVRQYTITGLWLLVALLFSIGVYRSTTLRTRQIADPSFKKKRMQRHLKHLFGFYGVLVMIFLLFSGMLGYTNTRFESSQLNSHQTLRNFLFHFNHDALTKNHTATQFPKQLRFAYISKTRHGRVNQKGGRFLVSGPWEAFPKGHYTAHFMMRVQDNRTDEIVASLEIVGTHGKDVFRHHFLRGQDFAKAGKYQRFSLPFVLPIHIADLETRVYFHNRVDLSIRKILIEPDLSEFYYEAGISAMRDGKNDRAAAMFRKAASLSTHVLALYHLALLEQLSGNWKASLSILKQAASYNPTFADVYYRMGLAYDAENDFEHAQQHFEQAVQLLPAHLDAWKGLEQTYRQLNEDAAQTVQVEDTIRQFYDPQYPYAANIGNQLMFMGYSLRNSEPGRLELEYYWKVLTPIKRDIAFFVHFKKWFRTVFQYDYVFPLNTTSSRQEQEYPVTYKNVGELIRVSATIPAPTGRFRMHLGVWEPTKQHLPIVAPLPRFFLQKPEQLTLGSVLIE